MQRLFFAEIKSLSMIARIPQRKQDDCTICTVAMVMGSPYSYERVLADSSKYPKVSSDGKFSVWWETYLADEGFQAMWCKFEGLYALPQRHGEAVGVLSFDFPHLDKGHVVTVDELGVVDPADNAPDHVPLSDYILSRILDGAVFHKEWLAVRKPVVTSFRLT